MILLSEFTWSEQEPDFPETVLASGHAGRKAEYMHECVKEQKMTVNGAPLYTDAQTGHLLYRHKRTDWQMVLCGFGRGDESEHVRCLQR